ncbi:flagellar basal body-associated protein FliL [uncultured Massilia sp.]|uniref:flagellar basal body-associated FliL family protein n=1 Tax=uncultured Massilia sp. TaxID=169973 RepID=UPI0025D490DC|nr:flagellar basal body-associated FliL family protein [uncultured Massilia sp.]
MNSKVKMIVAIAGAVVVSAAAAGGAVWWFMPKPAAAAGAENKKAEAEKPKEGKPLKYVTLEKVIVMLRRDADGADTHYLSTDLVLSTEASKEKETKENLPLLRSLAVSTLSTYTMADASKMTVKEYAENLNKAFDENYEESHTEKPFVQVMIGKLIIE